MDRMHAKIYAVARLGKQKGKQEQLNNARLGRAAKLRWACWRCFCQMKREKTSAWTAIEIFVFMLAKHSATPFSNWSTTPQLSPIEMLSGIKKNECNWKWWHLSCHTRSRHVQCFAHRDLCVWWTISRWWNIVVKCVTLRPDWWLASRERVKRLKKKNTVRRKYAILSVAHEPHTCSFVRWCFLFFFHLLVFFAVGHKEKYKMPAASADMHTTFDRPTSTSPFKESTTHSQMAIVARRESDLNSMNKTLKYVFNVSSLEMLTFS